MSIRSHSRVTAFIVALTALLAGVVLFPTSYPVSAQSPGLLGPIVGPPSTAVSMDRDLRTLPQPPMPFRSWIYSPRRLEPQARFGRGTTSVRDTVRQSFLSPLAMPPLLSSLQGLSFATGGTGYPPDPNGAVGPNHYVQTVNTSVAVYDKSGTLLAATFLNSFFSGGPFPCATSNRGDPIVLYDHLADRWLLSDMAWSSWNGPYFECLAVSKTGDPVAGGWWTYALQTDTSSFGDYPKMGIWSDGYYLSANLFTPANVPTGVRVWALDRQAMVQGQPLQPVSFTIPCSPTCYNTLLPANLLGATPPAGTPEFFASVDMPNILHLWKFHVDWGTPSNSALSGPTNLSVAPFAMPCDSANNFYCVPGLGGSLVDGLGDRLMHPLQYRRINGVESLWATHTVAADQNAGTPTGVRWYEIRDPSGTPVVYQQGTFQPDSNYRWMASLATDHVGNMAIGYSVSSEAMYPAIRYAGRLVADPLGTLGQGESTVIQGTGSQNSNNPRWGDYSAMMIDPTDDCTFWYTNEYYGSDSTNWLTQIASFKFPNCTLAPVQTPTPTPTVTPTSVPIAPAVFVPTATPKPPRCEDAYEPDNTIWQAHTITGPELHNFHSPTDEDWVKFLATSDWVYWIKAEADKNMPTAPRLELYVDGIRVASKDHASGNNAELWWWNNGPDRTAFVRVTEVNGRGDCGNSQYTLAVRGYQQKP